MPEPCGSFTLSCPRIFDGDQFLEAHSLVVREGSIDAVVPEQQRPTDIPHTALQTGTLAPGFIDLQVNGGGDVLFHNTPDAASVQTILAAHRARGTTSILPTLLSGNRQLREAGIAAVARAADTEPGILGIHIEGPFFAPAKHGAHQGTALELPTDEAIAALCATACRVLLTLAPEVVDTRHIRQLKAAGVLIAAGHTEATFEQMQGAQQAGLDGVTHLFNAMSALTGREPGAVGAAFTNDALWASVIADGHHVHPASIALAARAKPKGKLILVSDAMATVGGSNTAFALYDERIELRDGKLINREGKLAGSAIALIDAVRYTHQHVGLPLAEALRMASLYPAQILDTAATLGRLAPGYRADIVHFDDTVTPLNVWAGGRLHG